MCFLSAVSFSSHVHSDVGCTCSEEGSAQSSGRCFNCLRRNYLSRNCRSMSKCKHCNGRHHTAICERESNSRDSSGCTAPPELNPEAHCFSPDPTTSTLCMTKGKATLLETARAVLYNLINPKQAPEVHLLLDSGSQRSCLTERAKKLLQLNEAHRCGAQTLSIAAFGAIQDEVKVCPVVSVTICLYPLTPLCLCLFFKAAKSWGVRVQGELKGLL